MMQKESTPEQKAAAEHHAQHLAETKENDKAKEIAERDAYLARKKAAVELSKEMAEKENEEFEAMKSEEAARKEAKLAAKKRAAEAKAARKEEKAVKKRASEEEKAARKKAKADAKAANAQAHVANKAGRRQTEEVTAARKSEGQGYLESAGREIVPGTERMTPKQVHDSQKNDE